MGGTGWRVVGGSKVASSALYMFYLYTCTRHSLAPLTGKRNARVRLLMNLASLSLQLFVDVCKPGDNNKHNTNNYKTFPRIRYFLSFHHQQSLFVLHVPFFKNIQYQTTPINNKLGEPPILFFFLILPLFFFDSHQRKLDYYYYC